jgi:hypothetical protein
VSIIIVTAMTIVDRRTRGTQVEAWHVAPAAAVATVRPSLRIAQQSRKGVPGTEF